MLQILLISVLVHFGHGIEYEVTDEACADELFISSAEECEAAANALNIEWNSCCQNGEDPYGEELPNGCVKRAKESPYGEDPHVFWNGNAYDPQVLPCDYEGGNCEHWMKWAVCYKKSKHYIVRGRLDSTWWTAAHPISECMDDESSTPTKDLNREWGITVRCCSMDGSSGYSPDCNAYPKTYQEAVELCMGFGHRLCTLDEAMSGVPQKTGCGFDTTYHWTSDQCAQNSDLTDDPTIDPTDDPTDHPAADPTDHPTADPTDDPATDPTIPPPAWYSAYEHEQDVQPQKGLVLTHIDIEDTMHFEMDIVVHSFPTALANIFRCGQSLTEALPAIWISPESAKWAGFISRLDNYYHIENTGDGLVAGQLYHWELDITPDSYTVSVLSLDGTVRRTDAASVVSRSNRKNVVCYLSDPWYPAADVTIMNLRIDYEEPTNPTIPQSVYEAEYVQPHRGWVLTHIDIEDTMHFEMDIVVNSFPADWGEVNIFHCGQSKDQTLPAIWIHPGSDHAFMSSFPDQTMPSSWTDLSLVVGPVYHWELDFTPDSYTVTVDGVVTRYRVTGLPARSNRKNVVCYASSPWYPAADVNISNLRIDSRTTTTTTTHGPDVGVSAPMAGAASADPNAGDHGSDGFESMAMGAAVGAMVIVLIAVFVVLLVNRRMRKAVDTSNAAAVETPAQHVPDTSVVSEDEASSI